MSLEGLEEPWGQLVSTERSEGEEEERLPLLGSQFQIGRDKGQQARQQLFGDFSAPPSSCRAPTQCTLDSMNHCQTYIGVV